MGGNTSIADVVLHPVRLRIVQQLGGRNLTTGQLRSSMPDVTQATLYRHVASLIEADIITVVEERRVRGAVERTLALGSRMAHVDQDGLRKMSNAQLRSAFLVFLGDLSADFDRLVDSDDAASRDFLGFGRGPIYANAEDLAAIQAGLNELLAPYTAESAEGRRRLSLATILIPDVGPPGSPDDAATAAS